MNQSTFLWFFEFSNQNAIFDAIIVFTAKYLPYILVLAAIMVFLGEARGKRQRVFYIGETIMALILSRGIITPLVRFFYAHPRPFDALGIESLIPESGNSFPSGHAAFFFALATVIFMHNRKWGAAYFVFSLVIGLARVMAGVHWPLDILGGTVVGILSGLTMHVAVKPYFAVAPAQNENEITTTKG